MIGKNSITESPLPRLAHRNVRSSAIYPSILNADLTREDQYNVLICQGVKAHPSWCFFALIRIVILIAGLVAERNVSLADVVKLAPEPRLAVTPTPGAEEVSKFGNTIFLFISLLLQNIVVC